MDLIDERIRHQKSVHQACENRLIAFGRLAVLTAGLLFLPLASASGEDNGRAQARQASLETILVIGIRERPPTEEAGYKPDVVTTTGPWGNKAIGEIPFSITVLPSDLIKNSSARNLDELFTLAPLVQAGQSQDINNIAQATLRGFNVARTYVNGVQNNNLGMGVFVEEIEQLEILNGLSGFLYGASPVGGVINYRLKGPTEYDLRNVTIGNYGGQQYYAHVDLGGTFDADSRFGYRLNLLLQDGETEIRDQALRRDMISGSVDWRPADNTVLELSASRKHYDLDGRQLQFFLGGNVPAPLDGSRLHAPKTTYLDVDSDLISLDFAYQPSGTFAVRSAYQYKKDTRSLVYAIGSLLDEEDFQFNVYGGRNAAETQGGYFYLDSPFSTGSVKHQLTVGVNGYYYVNSLAILSNGFPSFFTDPYTYSLSDPSVVDLSLPSWNLDDSHWVVNARSRSINMIVGDDITFDSRWSMLVGVTRSLIHSQGYDFATGAPLPDSRYDKAELTPTGSILYKPNSVWTTYMSYMESLEAGSIVGPTYANAYQVLPPLVSHQYEMGAKGDFDRILVTAAVFYIDKVNERSNDGTETGTYIQDGREIHKGIEVSAIGRPVEQLSIMAGLSLMDNEVRRSSDPSLDGKQPNWVAEQSFKIRTEYFPGLLPGWTFSAGFYYNGESYQDPLNTRKVPSYTLFDLGIRYRTKIMGHGIAARFNVLNAGDERYWAATSPGSPRTVAFSISGDF